MSDSLLADLDDLIKKNPNVDGRQLREALEQLEKLKEEGLSRPGYGIELPHERRPLTREPGARRTHN